MTLEDNAELEHVVNVVEKLLNPRPVRWGAIEEIGKLTEELPRRKTMRVDSQENRRQINVKVILVNRAKVKEENVTDIGLPGLEQSHDNVGERVIWAKFPNVLCNSPYRNRTLEPATSEQLPGIIDSQVGDIESSSKRPAWNCAADMKIQTACTSPSRLDHSRPAQRYNQFLAGSRLS